MVGTKTGCGTSLVVLKRASAASNIAVGPVRPNASFVTHLIATAAGVEQTRPFRRAASAVAICGYGGAEARRRDALCPSGGGLSLVA